MDFSQEELFDACDRLVHGLLDRAGVTQPPVDALRVADDHLGIPVEVVEPEEDDPDAPPRRRRPAAGIVLNPHMTDEQRQAVAAQAIALLLLPDLLRKLDIVPGSESKQAATHFRGLLAARVLVPTRMLRTALRQHKYDVPALHSQFRTARMEAVALRLLDLDSPCVIAVVDDGVVAVRKGNGPPADRKLTAAEQQCHDRVRALELPERVRTGGWTADGWPVPNRRFRRVLLRAVPDEV
ncbi:ImmA/IrrE family metallo-endopeptidase [bacterium]|nr:ImmA/IrrE family metallo-endopeptidase [bacterium]